MLASNALTTIDDVKKELNIANDDDTKNEYIEKAINTASALIETVCNRKFKLDTYSDFVHETSDMIVLSQFPVHSIIENGIETQNMLYSDGGILYKPVKFGETLTYKAGYLLPNEATIDHPCTLPIELQNACTRLVSVIYSDDEIVSDLELDGIKSFTLGDLDAEFNNGDATNILDYLPSDILSVLFSYRKVSL